MKQMNDYQKKANRFLDKFGMTLHAELAGEEKRCPLWCDGNHYHGDHYIAWIMDKTGEREDFRFDFWNSLISSANGNRPTNYEILSCLACDIEHAGSLLNDEETQQQLEAQSKEIEAFFTEEELEELKEIV